MAYKEISTASKPAKWDQGTITKTNWIVDADHFTTIRASEKLIEHNM